MADATNCHHMNKEGIHQILQELPKLTFGASTELFLIIPSQVEMSTKVPDTVTRLYAQLVDELFKKERLVVLMPPPFIAGNEERYVSTMEHFDQEFSPRSGDKFHYPLGSKSRPSPSLALSSSSIPQPGLVYGEHGTFTNVGARATWRLLVPLLPTNWEIRLPSFFNSPPTPSSASSSSSSPAVYPNNKRHRTSSPTPSTPSSSSNFRGRPQPGQAHHRGRGHSHQGRGHFSKERGGRGTSR